MLFQVLSGFKPIFYTTHPNEEPKIANTLTNSYTYKKLSKKKTCYFKVRSYVTNNGVKEYSGFTAVVKARA